MNRRQLFKRAAAAGILLATPEPVKRFWALDQTQLHRDQIMFLDSSWVNGKWFQFAYINWRTGEITPYPATKVDLPVGFLKPDGFIMNATLEVTLA